MSSWSCIRMKINWNNSVYFHFALEMFNSFRPTFLNVYRLHSMFPYPLMIDVCWALAMAMTSNFCTFIGNKYQSPQRMLNRSHNSQMMKIVPSAQSKLIRTVSIRLPPTFHHQNGKKNQNWKFMNWIGIFG